MCELLICAQSRSSYRRGDIAVVMEDGHEWGVRERLPLFVVVKIPGVPASRVRPYVAEERGAVDPFTGYAPLTRRRRWWVRVDDVPASIRNALRNTGTVTVTWTQVRNFVQDKVTLVSAPDLDP